MKTIVANKKEHNQLMKNLTKYFDYDFALFINLRIDKNGNFEYPVDLNLYWDNPDDHWIYLFYYEDDDGESPHWDNHLIGFAMVVKEKSKFTGDDPSYYIEGFYIYPAFRRLGYGQDLAWQVIQKHKGLWQWCVMMQNTKAKRFWKKFSDKYLPGYKKIRYIGVPEGETDKYDVWLYEWKN